MKRKVLIAALCLPVVVTAGWMWLAAKQQPKRVATAPAAPLPVQPASPSDVTGKTVAAAQAFLATLDDAGRTKVSFPFDSAQKSKWSNFPPGIYPRNGLRIGDLNARQRDAVFALLATALSQRGLQKVKEIMEGDEVLKNSEGSAGPTGRGFDPQFGRDHYYITLLGTPSLTDPWMIQFGGHHLAITSRSPAKRTY